MHAEVRPVRQERLLPEFLDMPVIEVYYSELAVEAGNHSRIAAGLDQFLYVHIIYVIRIEYKKLTALYVINGKFHRARSPSWLVLNRIDELAAVVLLYLLPPVSAGKDNFVY